MSHFNFVGTRELVSLQSDSVHIEYIYIYMYRCWRANNARDIATSTTAVASLPRGTAEAIGRNLRRAECSLRQNHELLVAGDERKKWFTRPRSRSIAREHISSSSPSRDVEYAGVSRSDRRDAKRRDCIPLENLLRYNYCVEKWWSPPLPPRKRYPTKVLRVGCRRFFAEV